MITDSGGGVIWTRCSTTRSLKRTCPACAVPDARNKIAFDKFHMAQYLLGNASNGPAESMNARIQRVKKQPGGFRNRERFRNAIYLHCGGLDLYPETLKL
jgi:hypothetical protein